MSIRSFFAAALALTPAAALALPLAPGDVINPVGVTFTPDNSGLVINDNLIQFRMDPTPATPLTDVGGALQNRVLENFTDQSMVFMPRIRDTFNIDGGTFVITDVILSGYDNYLVDADFRTDGLGDKGPSTISRSADGDTIHLEYSGFDGMLVDAIAPGFQETSYFPALVTNAKEFDLSGSARIGGYLALIDFGVPPIPAGDKIWVGVDGLAVPTSTTVVPVPMPVMLLGTALAGMGFIGRRRRS